jgi:hypothetical protein
MIQKVFLYSIRETWLYLTISCNLNKMFYIFFVLCKLGICRLTNTKRKLH